MSEKISMMAAFAERLYARMAEDPRIRVMTADLVGSCALKKSRRITGTSLSTWALRSRTWSASRRDWRTRE